MTDRDITLMDEGLNWWSADRNEPILKRPRWACLEDCWHARTATMNDGRGARVQTRLDATSPILHGNLAHIFRAGSKVWAAGGVSHLREDEPAPRTP